MTKQQVISRPHGLINHRSTGSSPNPGAHRLYKRWITELWAGRRVAGELVTPDFVGHWPTRDVRGPDGLQAEVDRMHLALKELAFVLEVGPVVDGDMIAARWIATGSGEGGPVRYTGNDLLRVADGKIVEYWSGVTRS